MSIQKLASTTALVLTLLGAAAIAGAGVLDPDCTAQKAAKGAAKRAAGGVDKGAVKQPSSGAQGSAKKAVK